MPTLIVFGLVLRISFVLYGGDLYYKGHDPFTNGDTDSYTKGFINLWEHGFYSFNPLNPDAAFGRLPGYPFFWGLHYIVFGKQHVFQAVAYSHCLLDTVAIYLVYATAKALTRDLRAAWISALLYASYPFVLIWMTVSTSEVVATFLTIVVFWWLTTRPVTVRNSVLAGLLVGLALLVREYLGILLIPVFFWVYCAKGMGRSFVLMSPMATLAFLLLYIGWPIRNYVFQHRFMLLKPSTAGYDRYAEDVITARQWIYSWTPDANSYLEGIAGTAALPRFPAEVFASSAEATRAQALISRARECGTGFYTWRAGQHYSRPDNCNTELAVGFTALENSYKQRHPFRYRAYVPLLNLKKAFFKNQFLQGGGSWFVSLVFCYRSALLLISLWGAFLLRHRQISWLLSFFFCFMYLFICVAIRQLEMRYLIQADAIILCFAGVPLVWLFDRVKGRQKAALPVPRTYSTG